jgi:hypothetical protein
VTWLAGLTALDVVLATLGAGILMACGAWARLPPASRLGPAVLTGLAAAATLLGPLLYIGVSPTPLTAGLLAALSLAGGLAVRGRSARPPRAPSGGGLTATVAVGLLAAPLAARALVEPLVKLDAYSDWSLKARLLYGHGGLVLGALDTRLLGAPYAYSHREYPLGLPALEALSFHAAGTAGARVVQAQMLVLLAAFAATLWSLLRPHVDALLLGCCLCLLVAAPGLHTQLLAGYADVPVACFWAAATLALVLWLVAGGSDHLVVAGVLAAGALAVKQEGLLFDVALLVPVALALAAARDGWRVLGLAAVTGSLALSALPWRIFAHIHDLHDADIAPGPHRMADQAGQLPAITRGLVAELVWTRWPGIVPLAVLCALALLTRRATRLLGAVFLLIVGAAFVGLVGVYWNARVGIPGLLETSAERVVLAPILAAAAVLPLLLARLLDGSLEEAAVRCQANSPPPELT